MYWQNLKLVKFHIKIVYCKIPLTYSVIQVRLHQRMSLAS